MRYLEYDGDRKEIGPVALKGTTMQRNMYAELKKKYSHLIKGLYRRFDLFYNTKEREARLQNLIDLAYYQGREDAIGEMIEILLPPLQVWGSPKISPKCPDFMPDKID